jgi:hypothetical protein
MFNRLSSKTNKSYNFILADVHHKGVQITYMKLLKTQLEKDKSHWLLGA